MAANGRNFVGANENLPMFKHFFKVIWPEAIQTKKLMLPQKFAVTYNNELSREVLLEVPNSRVWRVRLTRERGDETKVWLHSGFGEFLRFYSIVARDCLIFKYNGRSRFEVVICDSTACEIAYPNEEPPASSGEDGDSYDDSEFDSDAPAGGEEEEEHSNGSGSESEQAEIGNPRSGDGSWSRRRFKRPAGTTAGGRENRGKRPRLAEEDSDTSADSDHRRAGKGSGKGKRVWKWTGSGASGSRRRQKRPQPSYGRDDDLRIRLLAAKIVTITRFWWSLKHLSTESKNAIHRAIDRSNPGRHSVLIVMKKTHIHPGIFNIPAKFAKRHFHQHSEVVTMRVYEQDEGFVGEWCVSAERIERNLVSVRRGWIEFCADNRLVEEDVCLFDLVDRKGKIFDVHIFRAE
ncbi:unnamed protein product [Linum trigynum]|uniref:TF-B3 domain-containing protein n=1 Tax=Linum trigynum TaxID=586398 RepID=A0AAV2DHA3_9ROSI